MGYTIRLANSAKKALKKIDRQHQRLIAAAIDQLSETPRPDGVKKLSGNETYRIRVKDYRIIYDIQDTELIVLVLTIGHRSKVYKTNA